MRRRCGGGAGDVGGNLSLRFCDCATLRASGNCGGAWGEAVVAGGGTGGARCVTGGGERIALLIVSVLSHPR